MTREEYVHRKEVSVRADMTDMFKREFAVEKSKIAVEKSLAEQKENEKRLTEQRVGLEKALIQAKLDSDSVFQREAKLWQDKKDLGKKMRHFDSKMHKDRILEGWMDLRKEQEKFNAKVKKDKEDISATPK